MELKRLRRILGDTAEPRQWEDAELLEWIEDADPGDNEYDVAADVLDALRGRLVLQGGGTSLRTDDLTLNDYNNIVLLRERIRDLRIQAKEFGTGMAVSYPYAR